MITWPAEVDAGDGVVLRGPDPVDAEAITDAVQSSLDELRPWMPWAAEPSSVAQQAVRLAVVGEAFAVGGDASYTVFVDDEVAGVVGVNDRLGDPAAREVGYWLRTSHVGRGVMTRAVLAVVGVLADVGIERAEIHCDEANHRSAAVARRAGFVHVRTDGTSMVWERHLRDG